METRFYCFGKAGNGILTVRFTYRNEDIRIIGAGYWRKGKKFYEQKIKHKYTAERIGPVKIIPDFLPPPEELAYREDSQKVTLSLSKRSIAFFKESAAQTGTPYQTMIRRLVDAYAQSQGKAKKGKS